MTQTQYTHTQCINEILHINAPSYFHIQHNNFMN